MNNDKQFSFNYKKYLYGISFQPFSIENNKINVILSTMELSSENEILYVNIKEPKHPNSNNVFSLISSTQIEFPITNIEFSPSTSNLFSTSSENLRLYSIQDTKIKEELSFPEDDSLTSLSWSHINDSVIATSSINGKVRIYNCFKGEELYKFFGSSKECYDVSFSNKDNTFITCGGDGKVLLFDMRKMNFNIVIYESKDKDPIMKAVINEVNENYVAILSLNGVDINIIDKRKDNEVVQMLSHHKNKINNCVWAPRDDNILISVSDDCSIVKWDLNSKKCYEVNNANPIENCGWCRDSDRLIGVTSDKSFFLLFS